MHCAVVWLEGLCHPRESLLRVPVEATMKELWGMFGCCGQRCGGERVSKSSTRQQFRFASVTFVDLQLQDHDRRGRHTGAGRRRARSAHAFIFVMRISCSVARGALQGALCSLLVATSQMPGYGPIYGPLAPALPATAAVVSPFQPEKLDLEVWYQLKLHYFDDGYGELGSERFRAVGERLRTREPLNADEACQQARQLVDRLGDPYTYLISTEKYSADLGRMGAPTPPSPATITDAAAPSSPPATAAPSPPSPPLVAPSRPLTRPTVSWKVFERRDGELRGYLRVGFISGNTAVEVRSALEALKDAGAADLVLDLRGNGGGSVAAAVEAVGLLAPPTAQRPLLVLRTVERGGAVSTRASTASSVWGGPVQVWVDGRTASAAEVLAGALHDSCPPSVRLAGSSSTYGKGVIQGYYPLSDGGALVQSIARTETPSGRQIREGLAPDVRTVFRSTPPAVAAGGGSTSTSSSGSSTGSNDQLLEADVLAARLPRVAPACSAQ